MKLTLGIRRTARRQGSVGLGVRLLLPTVVLNGVSTVSLESELQVDLLLWQVRVKIITKPRRNYQVW